VPRIAAGLEDAFGGHGIVAGQALGNNVTRYGIANYFSRWAIDHSPKGPSRNEKARSARVFSTSRRAGAARFSGPCITAFALVRPKPAAEYRSHASRHSGGGGSPR